MWRQRWRGVIQSFNRRSLCSRWLIRHRWLCERHIPHYSLFSSWSDTAFRSKHAWRAQEHHEPIKSSYDSTAQHRKFWRQDFSVYSRLVLITMNSKLISTQQLSCLFLPNVEITCVYHRSGLGQRFWPLKSKNLQYYPASFAPLCHPPSYCLTGLQQETLAWKVWWTEF